MIAEAGLAALWLAAALALLQLVLAGLGLWMSRTSVRPELVEGSSFSSSVEQKNGASTSSARTGGGGSALTEEKAATAAQLIAGVRPVAIVQGLLAALSFVLLILLFIRSDMSVVLVAQNSHSAKPLMYKIAGAWGNHEGSMLLWVTVLAIAGGAIAIIERRLNEATLVATMAAQAAIALGFYAFLLIASNPFARLNPAAPEGAGLNPLLQDPGLAFHPPTLYFGYVGLSVAFSFAVGALVMRDVGPAFARAMRPWVLGAWIFLTIGITAGSYWAYYELGWGGWWFWDPVENASLMPWLAATALLHSVTVLATRDGLRSWTIMLAVVAFSMSMIGTFLVRSGILTSVHAFAVDPSRGSFILALLILYIGGALVLFGWRIGSVKQGSTFELVSREGGLIFNNLLLSVILGIVLIGTLYPIVAQAMGTQLSVGPPFFNKTTAPIALLLMLGMAVGPMIRWRRDEGKELIGRMTAPIGVALAGLVAVFVIAPDTAILPLLGLGFAFGLAVASVAPLWKRNLRRTPLFTYGMVVAHLGVAVSVAGMASEAAFTQEKLVAVRVGQVTEVGPYSVVLEGIRPAIGPNWSALEGRLRVQRGEATPFTMRPQSRFFSAPPTVTSEAAIETVFDGQLYTVLGQPDGEGRWQLRLWWKPFVTLIWLGGMLIGLGGLLSLIGRVVRERRIPIRMAAA
ncbi:heme lyase CcmF/NrfE family subunit [Sphingomonas sp. S1-29]|uniref:heme lyase CcmF/NrfE family subunit n=1 Tax=Sphingomonas sp. S1-29 TaxID=2991074 RepID=UPI0022401A6F|nr:heme lyase CcmF/NrfE family subunit [Sphingomonas sp. S1-29]UZK69524.1 heme lyase CcmF/NrfE family subunit [Sphingomonas sp. S1-29]